jgi:hypothetical protein
VAALASRQDRFRPGEYASAIGIQSVKCAGGRQAFDHAFIDSTRIHPRGKVCQRREYSVFARLDDEFDRLGADAL